jgi:hypothetical protein
LAITHTLSSYNKEQNALLDEPNEIGIFDGTLPAWLSNLNTLRLSNHLDDYTSLFGRLFCLNGHFVCLNNRLNAYTISIYLAVYPV